MVGEDASRARESADQFCAGSRPAQNGLEERLDMIVAQLSVIALELERLNEGMRWMK